MRHSHLWELNVYSNNQCKYKKNHSCNSNIQIFNIKLFNVLGSPSKILGVVPTSCPIVIIGDFNIDTFDQNLTQPNELQTYLDYYSVELWEK